jgi:ElaB protein
MDETNVKTTASGSDGQSSIQRLPGGALSDSSATSESASAFLGSSRPSGLSGAAASPGGSDGPQSSKAWDSPASSTSSSADRLSTVKETLSAAQDAVKQRYRVVSDSADDFVHESPWKAITMAALGGIVIGMLAAR